MKNKQLIFGPGGPIGMMTGMLTTMASNSSSIFLKILATAPVLAVFYSYFWTRLQIGWAVRNFWRRTWFLAGSSWVLITSWTLSLLDQWHEFAGLKVSAAAILRRSLTSGSRGKYSPWQRTYKHYKDFIVFHCQSKLRQTGNLGFSFNESSIGRSKE